MTKQANVLTRCLCLVAILFAALVFGAPATAKDMDADAADADGAEAEMTQAWMAAMTPGEAHAMLAKGVGTWNMEVKMWMPPATEPSVSHGTAERRMDLGGRVLVEEVASEMMGQPFQGFGMTGYDNVSGKYWGTWNDSVSTGIMVTTGTYDAEAGTLSFVGEYSDPLTGGKTKIRTVSHLQADKELMEYYETRDGEESKTMEIVYTRQE